jgi:GH15 family glucan-1,4-alpha-glucosidase
VGEDNSQGSHSAYSPISGYGFLSDCHSAALVSRQGSIDWLCWPQFDSPSVFAALLDADQGGSFSIRPAGDYETTSRGYVEGTNVLQTIFTTATGSVRLNDWLHTGSRQAICRLVKCLEGEVELELVCDPRPDYARASVQWEDFLGWFVAGLPSGDTLILDGAQPQETFRLRAGERKTVSLGWNRPGPSDLFAARRRAIEFWRDWSEDLALPLLSPEEVQQHVQRSALVLKGLQYLPTGAFVAAPTTSLPEAIGGERNWDYRYSWLRDSTFILFALRAVGKQHESESWFDYLNMIALSGGSLDLQIMYGINGEADIPETTLDHLDGYRGSRPVRIGNGAAKQRQLDVYGELLDSIWLLRTGTQTPLSGHRWALTKALAAHALEEWRNPDEGIWEIRGEPQHFVYSKVMCWVALDRAVRLARKDGFADAPLEEWLKDRDEIRADVLAKGWDEELGAFTQHYGSKNLDASNLLMAQVGFLKPTDPRFIATVRATQRELTRNGFVDRYRPEETDDGLASGEGTFAICSLWLVLALCQIGASQEAQELFARVLACSNDLGLLSEEISPDGEQLGNFPQGFTHIAIIACAFALERYALKAAQRQDQPMRPLGAGLGTGLNSPV